MPRRIITEADIRNVTAKYLHSVHLDPAKIPNIETVVLEAFKAIAPDKDVDPTDVQTVIKELAKKSIVNDKAIQEAAKKVIDHTAMEDLKFLIIRNARALGKKVNDTEVEEIIKRFKLDPNSSSIADIKSAVQGYFSTGKPLEQVTPTELRSIVKAELDKHGHYDERDLRAVLNKYLDQADQEKPVNTKEIQGIISAHFGHEQPEGPTPSPINPPQKPGGNNKEGPGQGGKPPVKQGGWVPPKDPKNPTLFEKIRLKLRRYGVKSLTRGARNWLTDNVNDVKRAPSRKKLIAEGETAAEALIGKMFLYFYDAKTKKELPYWDKFPLIFVIELYEDGWLGINLHYLPMTLRMKLFDKLLQYANDKSLDKITKLRLSYSLLKNVSQFPEVRPCIKRYLSTHVRSQLMPIAPVDWEIALFLPVEQFQKQPKEYVWKQSREKIRKLKGRK